MATFFIFILKSAFVLALLVSLFMLFMSRETFHRVNRFIMLSILGIALLLPVMNLGIESPFKSFGNAIESYFAEETAAVALAGGQEAVFDFGELVPAVTADAVPAEVVVEDDSFGLLLFVATIYFLGVALLVVRQAVMYVQVARKIARSRVVDARQFGCEGIRLCVHDGKEKPFSWFHWVVVSEEDLEEGAHEILVHETAHARAGHSWDIMFADAVIIMQWFNPLAWIMKNCLKDIHEFEADEAVINSGVNAKQYQLLIIKKAVGARLYSIANSFNHSLTKKRITMMCKEKSKKWRCAKALYILPVAAVAALSFSTVENANAVETELASKVNEIAMNGASVSGEISAGTPVIPETAVAADTVVYQVCEQQPEFPGGGSAMVKFLAENIKYPADAMEAGKGGKVFVQFVVRRDGSVNDVVIMKSSGTPSLDNEALRVVKSMPKWKPGMQRGEAVNVRFMIPVAFAPQGKTTAPKKESVITLEGGGMMVKKSSDFAIVVDGALYESMENIKNEDIESITVVSIDKLPAEEVDKYRARGKKGVLYIELKKKETASPVGNEAVYTVCEKAPEFPGGMQELMKWLQTNIKYPKAAREVNLQGKIIVQFIVDKEGKIIDAKAVNGKYSFSDSLLKGKTEEVEALFGDSADIERIDEMIVVAYKNGNKKVIDTSAPEKHPAAALLAAEAVRVVASMPKWNPGTQSGKAVNVKYMLPIQFRLQ
ncbi:MAG: M56 family metallopeptidase [Bacteroidales bacterium]|nr:M56 family metallopeptidase [Bacteroidales bacterium]